MPEHQCSGRILHQAGFTEGTPWIRVNSNYKEINAKQPACRSGFHFPLLSEADPLTQREKPVIVYGEFEPLYREHDQIFAYTRTLEGGEDFLQSAISVSMSAEMEIPEEFQKNARMPDHKSWKKGFVGRKWS